MRTASLIDFWVFGEHGIVHNRAVIENNLRGLMCVCVLCCVKCVFVIPLSHVIHLFPCLIHCEMCIVYDIESTPSNLLLLYVPHSCFTLSQQG